MSPYRRNLLVGATVLGGLGIFGWMFIKFGTKSAAVFAPPQIALHVDAARGDGLSDGSPVNYLGVDVGRVTRVTRKPDGTGVVIDLLVDQTPPLPGNVHASIRSSGIIGNSSSISLETDGTPSLNPPLSVDTKLAARYVGMQLDLIPPQFADAAKNISDMSVEITKTTRQLRESNTIADLDATVRQINAQVQKTGQVLDSVQSLVGDPKLRADVQAAIASVRAASENANRATAKLDKLADDGSAAMNDARTAINKTSANVDTLAKQVGDRLTQTASLLQDVQSITHKIDAGNGTAGALVNDPRLYQSLVDTSRELNATVTDLHRLVDQWEQEGLSLKLK